MKVLLVRNHDGGNINTRLPESLKKAQGVYPPLALAYIAGFLESNNVDVEILDTIALNLTKEETKKHIAKANPTIVGVTSMTPTCRGALEICELAKDVDKNILTVVGGVQMSVYPNEMISYSYVDVGVVGDGEHAMLDIVKKTEASKKVKGLVYGKRVENLDDLPFPARHLLPNDKYWCVITDHPFTTLMTSRGCPFRCGFCFPHDKVLRLRSAKNIVDEMEYIAKKYKFKEIMLYDDTFTVNRKHAVSVCKEILKRKLNVKWEAPTRVDRVDKKLLELMKKAGCIRLRYGIESGSPRILRDMNKLITLDQAAKAVKLTKEIGIENFTYFILGYARGNERTMQKTINFAKKIDPDWVMFTAATPLPKTKLYDDSVELGLIDKNYWKDFTLGKRSDRTPYLVKDADKWVSKAYKTLYLRPSFIWNKLRKVNSVYALKKNIQGALGILHFEMN
ncbi:MAG: radical SAM protein [Nanoarchaeota archaeon]|nr:radical SAM protein [Nanoarchaeota archaeon]